MIKVDIICGLLGTGKTTLIKQMLQTVYAGKKVAIIENEVGKVNLDSGEFDMAGIQVSELTSGCICCTLKLNFITALNTLGRDGSFDYMIVEPSGVADIRDILAACADENANAQVNRIIMVTNAKKVQRFYRIAGRMFIGQIKRVHTVWLNFTQGLTQEQIQSTKDFLWEINPLLKITDTPLEEITADLFPDESDSAMAQVRELSLLDADDGSANTDGASDGIGAGSMAGTGQAPRMIAGSARMRMRNPKANNQTIGTQVLDVKAPVSDEKFQKLIRILNETTDQTIFRVKGYLEVEEGGICRVDFAGDEVFLHKMENYDPEKTNKLVLIGWQKEVLLFAEKLRFLTA
ncbi:MAG: GTP-binding protein [Lachnospiraceae bacterium]